MPRRRLTLRFCRSMHRQFVADFNQLPPPNNDSYSLTDNRPANSPPTYTFHHPVTYETVIQIPTKEIHTPTFAPQWCNMEHSFNNPT